jgi:hypothetical protein
MKKILTILLFSFCISIPAILPFFHKGYFPTHDGEWAVVRLGDMFRALRDFQIPARYSGELNFGYGYPLFNFTYPLPYYLGIFIYTLGAGFVGSIKILFAGSVVLSAFFMFFASRALWKNNWAGVVSAILYIYFPYRMVDLYVRGSIGESLSFALFPLLFYLVIKLINKPSSLLIAGVGISVACLVMTHNIMLVLFMPIFIVFAMIQIMLKNKKVMKAFIVSIIFGIGVSSFFWLPALFEKSNILLSKIPIADRNLNFASLNQLIFPSWGFGIPTGSDGFSFQLGLVHLAIFIAVIAALLFIFIKSNKHIKDYSAITAGVLVILVVFYIFLLFKPSEFLWNNVPLLSEINYPWISLGVLGFSISLLAGFLCRQVISKYIVIILGIVSIAIVLPYAKPERYINNPDSYYLTNSATTTSSNELMPLWVKEIPLQKAANKVEVISGSANLKNLSFNSKKIDFYISASTNTEIKINTIYYPGWKIFIDKNIAQISYNNMQGVMEIAVPAGEHSVSGKFVNTPLRAVSNAISLLSVIMLIFFVVKRNKYAIY